MGTATELANTLSQHLETAGFTCVPNHEYAQGDLERHQDAVTLICTSNTGMGDLPANIAALEQELHNAPPPIYGRHYAIINLGDSSYPSFAESGKRLDELFQDLGARPVADMLIIDALEDSDPSVPANEWLDKVFIPALTHLNNADA